MAQLTFQHNSAVECKGDARDKFMARYLFRRAAYNGELVKALETPDGDSLSAHEKFKLVCDDLSPSNVFVDKDGKLVAVIDWEFCYFGPEFMASASPWWLLLQRPEYSKRTGSFEEWSAKYPRLLNMFVKALEIEEQKLREMATKGARKNDEQQEQDREEWES